MLLYIVTRPKVKSLPFYIPGRRTKVHLSGGSSQCRPLKGIPPPPPPGYINNKSCPYVYKYEKQQPRAVILCSQTSIIMLRQLAKRVWYTKSQSSLFHIYLQYSPNTCLYCTKVWKRTYLLNLICDAPLSRTA